MAFWDKVWAACFFIVICAGLAAFGWWGSVALFYLVAGAV